jgi:transposase-like protein
MNPQPQCCHHPQCPARGQVGQGHSRVQSQTEPRDRCITCGQTVAATTGPPCDRLRTTADLVTTVLTLRCHGCPIQALVAACGLAARTVAAWLAHAGPHCQQRHQHGVQQGQVDLPNVQADELWVKRVGRRVWMAMAMAVPSRLWLGGVLSPQQDLPLIPTLVQRVRACAGSLALLVCVDGWASDVTAFLRVCRHTVRRGHMGKRDARRRVVSGKRRVVRGTAQAIATVLAAPHTGTGINTADSERLNATCRASLAPLVRRGRAIAHTAAVLPVGMWLVGCASNVCWRHDRLRLRAPAGAGGKWQERTPAMAAGLAHHRWTMRERLCDPVPLPAWVAPKHRGRPPKRARQPAMAVAA